MITRHSNEKNFLEFNALEFENERYQVFQQTEAIPESALDANWDVALGEEPTKSQWLDPEYRKSYIESIARKYDEKYGLI